MIKSLKLIVVFTLSLFISSCASKKNTVYFQNSKDKTQQVQSYTNELIQKNDILNISVTALDMTSIAPFIKDKLISRNMEQLLIDGYKVTEDGSVNLPLVGNITIAGLSTADASIKIQKELKKSVIDPIVNIRVLNNKITVLGEVNHPGTFPVYDPKINIIQALGLAGDITIYGKKNNIKLIREINGNCITKEIDITDADFIKSDFYYLKNNDIIYVEPTFARIKNSGYIGQISNVATVFSLIMSIIILSQNN